MRPESRLSILTTTLLTTMMAGAEDLNSNVHGDPYIPVGTLAVNPTFVATGVKPNLLWEIEYPTTFRDLAVVGPSGVLSTTQEVMAEVRVLGTSLRNEETRGDLPVAMWIRAGGAAHEWQLVFQGKSADVNPSKVLFQAWIDPGTQIDIAARGQTPSGSWLEAVWTIDQTNCLAHLVNGATLPDYVNCFTTQEVETYTSGILNADKTAIAIGPKDLAYFFELSSKDPNESAFDLQDLVALVQLKTKNNNGHGNNADGVDVSNPGLGSGGPTGTVEASGTVDDEMKTFKSQ